jgi:chromosome segregation ATPase
LVWDIDGYGREFGYDDSGYFVRRIEQGELTLDERDHRAAHVSYPTLAERNEHRALVQENEQLKTQLTEQETPDEIVSDCTHCAELEQELETRRAASGELTKHNLLRIGELDDQVNSLRGKLGAAQKENNRLQQQVETLSTQLGEMENDFEVEDLRAELEKTQAEKHDLQQQLAQAELDVDTLTDCDQVVKELAETKQMLKMITEAKDKVILRNRELEAENTTLKTELEELRAKLAQYEGMGA